MPPSSSSHTRTSSKGLIVISDNDLLDDSSKSLERNSSSKLAAMAEKRVARRMENQLNNAQEEVKKLKHQLAATEDEKSHALHELQEMKRLADDMESRLTEALAAQKRAEDGWEAERTRAEDLELASIGMAQKRDQAWQLELEAVQKQHASDVQTLSSVEQELVQVSRELSTAIKTRDEALKENRDAKKAAEMNRKQISDLSTELRLMKDTINSDSSNLKGELDPEEAAPMIELLKHEFNKEKDMEERLTERGLLIENMKLEVSDAKEAEAQALNRLSESRIRIETLEQEVEKAKASEMRTHDSLVAQTKQLEQSNKSLEDAKSEIASLQETIRSLEASIGQSSKDLTASRRSLEIAKLDTCSVKEVVKTLRFELQTAKEDLAHAQERETLALSDSCKLAEEINALRNELKVAKEADKKGKMTMEINSPQTLEEASDAKAKVESTQLELQNAKKEIEDSKAALNKFKALLGEARGDQTDNAKEDAERLKTDKGEEFHDASNGREVGPTQGKKTSRDEKYDIKEGGVLIESLMKADEIAKKTMEETGKLRAILKKAVNEASVERESAEFTRSENYQLKDHLSDMGNSLHTMTKENKRLKIKEAAALEQVKELKGLLNLTPMKKSEVSKKLSMLVEEPKESKKTELVLAEQSKEEQMYYAEHENPSTSNGSKDDDDDEEHDDILKGSIFNLADGEEDMSPTFNSLAHRKAISAFLDDRDMLNSDDFDGNHFDDIGFDRSTGTRHRKKKLIHRFGDLLKKKPHVKF